VELEDDQNFINTTGISSKLAIINGSEIRTYGLPDEVSLSVALKNVLDDFFEKTRKIVFGDEYYDNVIFFAVFILCCFCLNYVDISKIGVDFLHFTTSRFIICTFFSAVALICKLQKLQSFYVRISGAFTLHYCSIFFVLIFFPPQVYTFCCILLIVRFFRIQ
jgi:hypothetical protein